MQEGSIVNMVKDYSEDMRMALKALTGIPPPSKGDTQYMITGLADEETCEAMKIKFGIFLDPYPEYEESNIPFDGNLFAELLPPGNNVEEIMEQIKEPVLT